MQERKKQIEDNIELYEGRAFNVYSTNQLDLDIRADSSDEEFLQKNVFKLITDTFVNLSVFEPVEFSLVTKQEAFDSWMENEDFQDFVKEAFRIGSICGDAIAVLYEENGIEKVKLVDPAIWEAVYNDINTEANTNILSYNYKIDELEYDIKKIFTYDKNTNSTKTEIKVFKGKENVSKEYIPEQILNDFGIKQNMSLDGFVNKKIFFRFQSEKSLKYYYGLPDYTENIKALAKTINNLLELEYYVQIKTGKALLTVPDSLLSSAEDLANRFSQQTDSTQAVVNSFSGFVGRTFDNLSKVFSKREKLKKLDFIPTKAGDTPPSYITPPNTAESLEKTINKLKQELFEDLALPTVFISSDFQVGNLTGVALQKMMTRTLHKKNSREIRMKKFLRDIIFNIFGEFATIQFGDGIVNDRKEKIEEIQTLLNNDLITRVDAVKELYQLTESAAQDYINLIDLQNGNLREGSKILPQPENLTQNTNG